MTDTVKKIVHHAPNHTRVILVERAGQLHYKVEQAGTVYLMLPANRQWAAHRKICIAKAKELAAHP